MPSDNVMALVGVLDKRGRSKAMPICRFMVFSLKPHFVLLNELPSSEDA